MRKWLKRIAKKFGHWRKAPAKAPRSASVEIAGMKEPVHIPLVLDPKLVHAARKYHVMIKTTGSTRRETRILARSNGVELEIRFFEGEKPQDHRTYEYDTAGKLTRATITVIADRLTTYIFIPKGNKLVLHHVERL